MQKQIMKSPIMAEGEKVSDIQSLTLRVQDLDKDVDLWNTAIIWALVFGAIAALAVVFTTAVAFRKAKQLTDAQAELIRAKDGQLAIDLKNKDVKIEDAKRDAAGAQKESGIANQRAGEANARAETERVERLKLEAQIQPRELNLTQQNKVGTALHSFRGSHVNVVSFSLDVEGWRLGQEIIASLRSGGLLVTDSTNNLMIFGGKPLTGIQVWGRPQEKELVDALTKALRSEGGLEILPPNLNPPPPDVADPLVKVQIMVGIKPVAHQICWTLN